MREHDVVIIGAGPVGIELAVELKKRGVDFAILEAGAIGSTMQWWAPGTRFFSSPERIAIAGVPLVTAGQDKATREEYLAYLRTVVGTFDLSIETYRRVVQARPINGGFELTTRRSSHGVGGPEEQVEDSLLAISDAQTIRARRVVLAIGDMHRPRPIGVEGERLPHVSHYFKDPHAYAGGSVLIVGGKNSAVEAAIRCYRIGCDVAVSYRKSRFDPDRIKYWLLPEIEWLIRKDRIRFYPNSVPAGFTPAGALLRPCADESLDSDNEHAARDLAQLQGGGQVLGGGLPNLDQQGDRGGVLEGSVGLVRADHVLLMTGYLQDPLLFEQLGVSLCGPDRKPRHRVETMETNVPGVFVIGTGSAGSQSRTRVFIETSHVHVKRVADALVGIRAQHAPPQYEHEES